MIFNFRSIDILRNVINFHWCKLEMRNRVSQIIDLFDLFISNNRFYRCINVVNEQLLNEFVSYSDWEVRKISDRLCLSSCLICYKLVWIQCIKFWNSYTLLFFFRLCYGLNRNLESSCTWFWWKYLLYFRLFINTIFKFFLFIINSF